MYGIPVSDILDFSASINPLGPSLMAVEAVMDGLAGLVNYPDPDSTLLRNAISGKFGIPPESVMTGNGSTEFIYLMPRALSPGSVLVIEPGFSDYARASKLAGARIRKVYLDERDGFRPDMDRVATAFGEADMAFVCNPNNPTGALISRDDMLRLMEAAGNSGTFLVIDEAFMDYAPDESVITEAAARPGVALLRNFTKFYGMPGIRSGYLVGHPDTVKELANHKEPWSVNNLAEAASVAALGDDEYTEASLRLMDSERPFMQGKLSGMDGLTVYTSSVNFMLVRLGGGLPSAPGLAAGLEKKGILIRDCSSFEGLGPEYMRLAVRTRRENELLLFELGRLLGFTPGG